MSWREQVHSAATDRVSGAQAIAVSTARAVLSYLEEERPGSVDALRHDLGEIAERMVRGQPSMAPVLHLLNDVLLAVEASGVVSEARHHVRSASQSFAEATPQIERKMRAAALGHLSPSGTLVTISYSSAVASMLQSAVEHGYNLDVICLESRPAFEGRRLAEELAKAGLNVTVMIDAASYDAMAGADLWVCGSDSLTVDGVVNKIGTAALSAVGQALGVPGYALCSVRKIWPAALGQPHVAVQDADEVWADAPENVRIINRYFDCAPWGGIEAVISEEGVLQPEEIIRRSQALAVHPRIRAVVRDFV